MRTKQLTKKYPKIMLGLSSFTYHIVKLISYKMLENVVLLKTGLELEDYVTLVIRKIRLNESFEYLGIEYGINFKPQI